MIRYFVQGGPLMWPLLFCSILSLAIILERVVYFLSLVNRQRKVYKLVKRHLINRNVDSAREACEKRNCPMANVFKTILDNYLLGKERLYELAKESISHESPKIEKNLTILGAIASISTLLGFTGTVTGMINAFESISLHGVSSPAVVASGISQALITTAFGLIIAIPSAAFYYYFSYLSERIVSEIEHKSYEVINSL